MSAGISRGKSEPALFMYRTDDRAEFDKHDSHNGIDKCHKLKYKYVNPVYRNEFFKSCSVSQSVILVIQEGFWE